MKVIFMGTPDFAVGTLEALVDAGHTVTLVVSQPDRAKGRGHAVQYTPVKEAALKHGLTVWQPERIRGEEARTRLEQTDADVIVVAAFGQIIPREILEMKKYGCINVHASLLPKYRGAAPIQWAVIDGERESGVTIMQMDEGLDTGDMLSRVVVPLAEDETGGSLFDRLSTAGAKLLVQTLEQLERGEIVPEKQGESPTRYASMLTKQTGRIDWSQDAAAIERLVRGVNPWPGAWTKLDGKTLKIWGSHVAAEQGLRGKCGEILETTKNAVVVQTGDGALAITELQMEGRKRMDAGPFLRGFPVTAGMILTTGQEE